MVQYVHIAPWTFREARHSGESQGATHAIVGYHSDCLACREQIDDVRASTAWRGVWVAIATLVGAGLVLVGANGVAHRGTSAQTLNVPGGGVFGSSDAARARGALLGIVGLFTLYVIWRLFGHRPVLVTVGVGAVAALLGILVG